MKNGQNPPERWAPELTTGESALRGAACSALQKCAKRVAGHITKPLDIYAIVAEIESDEYSAELMLHHLLLWAAKTERHLKDPHCVRAVALLGEIILPNAMMSQPPETPRIP